MEEFTVNQKFYQCGGCSSFLLSSSSRNNHSFQCRGLHDDDYDDKTLNTFPNYKLVTFPKATVLTWKLGEDVVNALSPVPQRRKINSHLKNTPADNHPLIKSEAPSRPNGVIELGEVHLTDRILITTDGTEIHCNGEYLDPLLDVSRDGSASLSISGGDSGGDDNNVDDNQPKNSIPEQEEILKRQNENLRREKSDAESRLKLAKRLLAEKILQRRGSIEAANYVNEADPEFILSDECSETSCQSAFEKNVTSKIKRRGRPRKRLGKIEYLDRRERKKVANVKAARSYRQRKQREDDKLLKQVEIHQCTQDDLKKQIDELQFKIKLTRELLRDKLEKRRELQQKFTVVPSNRKQIVILKQDIL